jgi:LPXTG-motif cell wall-anchored protein
MTIKNELNKVLALAIVTFAPVLAIAQDPPAPADGGGGEPLDVPLGDTTTNMIFLAMGLLFAGMIVFKLYSRKKATA